MAQTSVMLFSCTSNNFVQNCLEFIYFLYFFQFNSLLVLETVKQTVQNCLKEMCMREENVEKDVDEGEEENSMDEEDEERKM